MRGFARRGLLTLVFFCEFIWRANRLELGLQLASLAGYGGISPRWAQRRWAQRQ